MVAAVQAGDTEAWQTVGGIQDRFAGYTGLVPRHKTVAVVAVLAGSLAGSVRIAGPLAGSLGAFARSHRPCRAGKRPDALTPATHMSVSTGSRRTTEHTPGKLV